MKKNKLGISGKIENVAHLKVRISFFYLEIRVMVDGRKVGEEG